jgi:GTP-binding protein EngB required for normal cell division
MNVGACLAELENAADAAAALGVDASGARAVLREARARLGYPASTYVLALVGGTGVGKSTLLNALAGGVVSEAGARRPTTSAPVAWLAGSARDELAPLLAWLGVDEVQEHAVPAFAGVAVLDLPDIDSVAPGHRGKVDELLPRVDAVVWVTDPEKYRDALLHDDYVRLWTPRLARQLVVLNKSDLVTNEVDRVREHLASTLRDDGARDLQVVVASAKQGDVREIREWVAHGVEAKRIVAARIAAELRTAAGELAARAGVGAGADPLVPAERRARLLADVTREALALIDLEGLERQAIGATRLAARPRGAGPLGYLTTAVYRASGRDRVAADPEGFLRRWRERGSLARPAEPLRTLVAEILPAVPPEVRPSVASVVDTAGLATRIANAIDAAVVSRLGEVRAPVSLVWSAIGALQFALTAALLFVALWIAVVVFVRTPIGTIDLPWLGPVPTPVVLLAGLLVAGYVLARLLGAHAGLIGRRWARRLRADVSRELGERLNDALFAPLAGIDAARSRLAAATAAIDDDCGAEQADVARPAHRGAR